MNSGKQFARERNPAPRMRCHALGYLLIGEGMIIIQLLGEFLSPMRAIERISAQEEEGVLCANECMWGTCYERGLCAKWGRALACHWSTQVIPSVHWGNTYQWSREEEIKVVMI